MKHRFHVLAVLALAFGAMALFAQDTGKKEPSSQEKLWTALHEQCCGTEKCEGEKKKVCDRVHATVKAGMARCAEKCKKEGMKCEECAKVKDGGPCDQCREMLVKVLAPWIKNQAGTKDAEHTITGADGKKTTIKCTLTTGGPCKGCAEEMSDAVVKACKEASKK